MTDECFQIHFDILVYARYSFLFDMEITLSMPKRILNAVCVIRHSLEIVLGFLADLNGV